jgi:NAD(P)-dependent dehydrogenase (short-subunit alcohol dehydrogenase family)
MKLTGKVIVITGSTRGIGREIAEACAAEGGSVVISSRNSEAVKDTCDYFTNKGYRVAGIAADVANDTDIKKLFDFTLAKFKTIDVWINNAGLSGGYRMIYDIPEPEISEIINVNVTGMLRACRIIIPYFLAHNKGIIINMSGRGGRGEGAAYMATYTASKAAVTSLTKSLAKEYKDKTISIHSVLPGMVKTDFYKDIKVSPNLKNEIEMMPVLLDAFGVPIEKVGRSVVDIAAQVPGKISGKQYSLMTGVQMMKAIFIMMRYRMSKKSGA